MSLSETENRDACDCDSGAPNPSKERRGPGPIALDLPIITTAAQKSCCDPKSTVLVDGSGTTKTPLWVKGTITTPAGIVPRVGTTLTYKDRMGAWKARWSIGRMHYQIPAGLYAVGEPDKNSPVLVSANYKMSFDYLRRALTGISAWILVLDTKGINVWCAAGKGTFGTEEIIARLRKVALDQIVAHRTLIVPQLGAPGVAAHEVQRQTGFRVVYGPVRAGDIPTFLRAGNKATDEMRKVRFGLWDRLVLTPVEIAGVIKPVAVLVALLFVLSLVRDFYAPFPALVLRTLGEALPFFGAILVGAVLTPVLLPYVPGRAFSWKGWLLGFVMTVAFLLLFPAAANWKREIFYLLVLPAISSYLAMNFTGASTYTSLSGVVREMKTAVPALAASAGAGLVFLAVATIAGL